MSSIDLTKIIASPGSPENSPNVMVGYTLLKEPTSENEKAIFETIRKYNDISKLQNSEGRLQDEIKREIINHFMTIEEIGQNMQFLIDCEFLTGVIRVKESKEILMNVTEFTKGRMHKQYCDIITEVANAVDIHKKMNVGVEFDFADFEFPNRLSHFRMMLEKKFTIQSYSNGRFKVTAAQDYEYMPDPELQNFLSNIMSAINAK